MKLIGLYKPMHNNIYSSQKKSTKVYMSMKEDGPPERDLSYFLKHTHVGMPIFLEIYNYIATHALERFAISAIIISGLKKFATGPINYKNRQWHYRHGIEALSFLHILLDDQIFFILYIPLDDQINLIITFAYPTILNYIDFLRDRSINYH
ncbi:hypothetical protein ACJX0J_035464 [Zea mays]